MNNKINYSVTSSELQGSEIRSSTSVINYGRVMEKVVRRNPMGISELARRLDVSRKTIYNWFETENLNYSIIIKVGTVIEHDFSIEFPNKPQIIVELSKQTFLPKLNNHTEPSEAIYYWMDRYIKLLEKFNKVLSHDVEDVKST